MTTQSSDTSSPLVEALNATEVGSFIAKHLTAFIALLVLLVVGILGYGIYRYQQEQRFSAYSETLYRFQEAELAPFLASEASVDEFMAKLKGIREEVGGYVGLVPLVVQASDELLRREQWEQAIVALKMVSSHKSNPYIHYFLASREAQAYEDMGQYTEAIGVLEGLRANSIKLMEDKLYLDLGRLYMKTDNKEKARLSFEYVLNSTMAQDEFSKLARLYLAEL